MDELWDRAYRPPIGTTAVRPTQDGRAPRRYKRRWVVERFFAWLHNSRRLVTRWERHVENFVAMLQLACMRILLNRL